MTQQPSDLTASLARLLLTQEGCSPAEVSKHLGFSQREVRSTRARYARDPETGYPSPAVPRDKLPDDDLFRIAAPA